MAKVTIDGKEYDTDNLPKEAVDLINSLLFVENELRRLQNQISIYNAAKVFYIEKLREFFKKEEVRDIL